MGEYNNINTRMAKYAPELVSGYAKYPLRQRNWLKVTDETPKGEPCFISSPHDIGVTMHYVYGAGPKGFGYYHLMTKSSYRALYARMTHETPIPMCCLCFMSKKKKKECAAYGEVQELVYKRSRSSRPYDGSF
jgi:hypothetical protein